MQLKPYPKYKDSGIQWIGKIPEGWEVRKLKYLVKDLPGNGFPEEEQGKDVGDIPFYKVSDINGSEKFVEIANNFVSKKTIKDHKWNTIQKYSLIAPKIGEALKKNHRKITKVKCIIDNNCIAFNTFDIDYNYNYYLFKLINFEWFVNPGAVPSLSIEKLRSSIVSLPPLTEQTTIANFLDKKTVEIDALIEKDKKLIVLLKEKRTALINHAVTKGLNPNVKLKDFGIEWIGEIPEEWEVKKVKQFSRLFTGSTPDSGNEKYWDGDITWVTPADLSAQQKFIKKSKRTITREGYDNSGTSFVSTGAIILATRAPIGYPTIVGAKLCFNQGCKAIEIKKDFIPDYLYYYLNAYVDVLVSKGNATTFGELSSYDLTSFKVLMPTIQEQTAIANFLDKATSKIDKTIEKIEKKIALLEEYKKSLIHHVVTGKIDVREVEA